MASWSSFYGGDHTWHNLHLEVCVGHDTSYDLHGFFLVLVILVDVRFHLHWIWDWLEIVITSLCSCMSCERCVGRLVPPSLLGWYL